MRVGSTAALLTPIAATALRATRLPRFLTKSVYWLSDQATSMALLSDMVLLSGGARCEDTRRARGRQGCGTVRGTVWSARGRA